jgi:iron complex outermembrane receptor protein
LRQSRLFLHDEWRVSDPIILNAGAMWEDDGMANRKLSPKMTLNYHATPEHTFRVGVSVAYRNPSLIEENSNKRYVTNQLKQDWLSSGGLRPERTLSREVGYIGELHNGLTLDVRAYDDQVSNIIFIDPFLFTGPPLQSAYNFRNEFDAHYTGIEGTIKYNWKNRSRLALSFSHQMVSAALVGVPTILSQAVPPIPPAFWLASQNSALTALNSAARNYGNTVPLNSGSLLFYGDVSEVVSYSVGYYQQGAVQVLVGTSPQPLNRRVDMRLARQLGRTANTGHGGEVALVLQNVFNNRNIGYSGYTFDRRAYLTATFNF